ncbi:DNA-binding transcriptional regulator, FrmR family [Actinopolymorpha cephalotaxi]|uniref:DNA-binding FrmR family transcriptional regulator n=1 Tax=Actinopolymorpha cephalotaxi TaxID=504797 RepID=A0A1I2MBU2_9ACTN|nr:DNA-binding FrmR family transcriptional regulator [Actinopolymorpha cephalotaxi]SFF88912.1 DNA-binding transcriptional regulator, FrmR family [Actinopolymorpha cephalotaxi]
MASTPPSRRSKAGKPSNADLSPVQDAADTAADVVADSDETGSPGSVRTPSPYAGHRPPGYLDQKDAHLKRLRRIEGQVRGLQRQVENDTYCIDVLTQVSAATRALESFALGLLDEHLAHCVSAALASGDQDAQGKVKEASAAIARLVRS